MIELTLEQACEKHCTHAKSPVGSILYIHKTGAFKAGAEYGKHRFDKLLLLAKQAATDCEFEGNMQMADDLRNEIEKLESE
jgi:hypothetical protein